MVVIYLGIALVGAALWYVFGTPEYKRDEHMNLMDPIGSTRFKNAIGYLMAKISVQREHVSSRKPPEEIERFHHAENHEFWNESYYFNACDKTTKDRVITRLSHRGAGGKETYVFLLLDLVDHGILSIEQDHVPADLASIDPQALGIKYTCIEPMRKWRITYKGKMRKGCATPKQVLNEPGEYVDVEIDLLYVRNTQIFWYMRDDKLKTLALNLSQEPWDLDFWKACLSRSANHAHYEDFGTIEGHITVSGKTKKYETMTSFRDHSWDIRRWQAMDHLFLLLLTFDEPLEILGHKYRYLDLTLVWMPGSPTLTRYSTGYILGYESDQSPALVLTGGTPIRNVPYRTLPNGSREPMDKHDLFMYVSTQNGEKDVPIRIKMDGEARRLIYYPDDHQFECLEDSVNVKVINYVTEQSVSAHGTRQSGYRVGDFDPSKGGCG